MKTRRLNKLLAYLWCTKANRLFPFIRDTHPRKRLFSTHPLPPYVVNGICMSQIYRTSNSHHAQTFVHMPIGHAHSVPSVTCHWNCSQIIELESELQKIICIV